MQFSFENKRDPLTVLLIAAAVFITIFITFDLLKGLHRYRGGAAIMAMEKKGPAGVSAATLSSGGLELSGWALRQTTVQISDSNKTLKTAMTSEDGKWSAVFPYDRYGRNIQILNLAYQENDKTVGMGRLEIFAPNKSTEDTYIWWEGPLMDLLLQSPTGIEDTDLFLVLARTQPDKGISFAGNAAPGDLVQVYADNEYIGVAAVGGDGRWITPALLRPDRRVAELRFDDVYKEDVVERRVYHLTWAEGKDGWVFEWPLDEGKKETIAILKPEAGSQSSPDEQKPGQVIPVSP